MWDAAAFCYGHTVLDIGCGPGYGSIDLAYRLGPNGRVIARDSSARFIEFLATQCAHLGLGNVDAKVGDVHSLDLPAESIDGAYAGRPIAAGW